MQDFVETIVAFVREHESWAVPIAFLVAFGELFCFLSLLWPGTAILIGITALIAASGVTAEIITPLVISATLGGTLGYSVSYWIGRYFEGSIASVWPFTRHPDMIPAGERFFMKYGGWSVFLGHFFGPVRAVIPVVAGMFRMPQIPFQIANFVSALIWAVWVVGSSFYLVTFKDEVFAFLRAHAVLVAALMFVAAALNAIPTALFAVPSLLAFVTLGAFHLYAGGDIVPLFAVGVAGAMLGDVMGYRMGRGRGAALHAVWPSGWGERAAIKAQGLVERQGVWGLVASKFMTTQRGMVPLAAGAAGASMTMFLIASLVSSAVWSGVLLAPRPLAKLLIGW